MARRRTHYHAAPPEVRAAIQAEGLRPGTGASYGPPAVYLFRDRLCAEHYYSGVTFDVYAVDTTGLLVYPDPEDPAAAAYVLDPIPAERLRFLGAYRDGELVE